MKFISYELAQRILGEMDSMIYNLGFVTVAEFKDLIGDDYTNDDHYKGWTDISKAKIVRSPNNGRLDYSIELPNPETIEL